MLNYNSIKLKLIKILQILLLNNLIFVILVEFQLIKTDLWEIGISIFLCELILIHKSEKLLKILRSNPSVEKILELSSKKFKFYLIIMCFLFFIYYQINIYSYYEIIFLAVGYSIRLFNTPYIVLSFFGRIGNKYFYKKEIVAVVLLIIFLLVTNIDTFLYSSLALLVTKSLIYKVYFSIKVHY
jgi:hypothetical protein